MKLFAFQKRAVPAGREPAPAHFPKLDDIQVAALYRGQRQGGDFFDVLHVNTHRLLLLMLDVAGKRAQALSIAADVQDVFRSQGPAIFGRHDANEAEAISELMFLLNRKLLEKAGGVCFTPGFVACYNQQVGAITYINAGHVPGLICDNESVTELPAGGIPFGLFSHATHEAGWHAVAPGASLLMVSRGLIEARDGKGEYGMHRLKQIVAASRAQTAQDLCAEVLQNVRHFVPKDRIDNDITAMALMRSRVTKSRAANAD